MWVIGILGVTALVVLAVVFALVFPILADEVRHWPDVARQAAYAMTMVHMLAVLGIVRVGGMAVDQLVGGLRSSERFEEEFVHLMAMWGAAYPFLHIGERFAQTHAGAAVFGLVAALIVIAAARISRRIQRSISTWEIWAVLGFVYVVIVHGETEDWTSPPVVAGYVMLAVCGAWEAWRWQERKRLKGA